MKGGRTAPRDSEGCRAGRGSEQRFNEGGADCPPRPACLCAVEYARGASMKGGRTAPRDGSG